MPSVFFVFMNTLVVGAYMRQVSLEVIPAGEKGGKCHNCHTDIGENVILLEERNDGLDEYDYGTDHLRYCLDLAEHRCRNYDSALACNNES